MSTDNLMRVFFYGLFMDERLLAARGLHPQNVRTGFADGYALRIGERASMVETPHERVYGVLMDLSRDDVAALYADPSLRDYAPVEIDVTPGSGVTESAACYLLPGELLAGSNPGYARKLAELARELGFPDGYTERIRRIALGD